MKKIINKISFYISYVLANYIFYGCLKRGNNAFMIMSDEDLVDEIVGQHKSFSRFGDGELSLILNSDFRLNFQDHNEDMNERLKAVLKSSSSNLIIGISRSLNDPCEYNKRARRYYNTFNFRNREKYKKIIPIDKVYGNASITRFYIDYDNDNEESERRISLIKKIWDNRDVIIVEGELSKIGVGNDLLSNARKIKRIIVPSQNAYNQYNAIVEAVINNASKSDLIMLAVGPTATLLAYDLSELGFQAVDIGHVDIEYEWMIRKAKKRIPIPGKYVNEVKGEKYTKSNEIDDEYIKSIIVKI